MSWFELDPQNVANRAQRAKMAPPSLLSSLVQGIVGFMFVGMAGFAPWAFAGMWLHNTFGEGAVYTACALAFIACSGPALHRLMIGPGSLSRFYKVFALAFGAYAATWIFCWMMIAGETGCLIGLCLGAIIMGWLLAHAFGAARTALPVIVVLCLFNLLGYYGGSALQGAITRSSKITMQLIALGIARPVIFSQLLWGASYGVCFGAGLGLSFYIVQGQARALLKKQDISAAPL